VHARTASGDDNTVKMLFFDGFTDFLLAGVCAGVAVLFDENYVGEGFGVFGYGFDIYRGSYV
jgi:hypothetical protein